VRRRNRAASEGDWAWALKFGKQALGSGPRASCDRMGHAAVLIRSRPAVTPRSIRWWPALQYVSPT